MFGKIYLMASELIGKLLLGLELPWIARLSRPCFVYDVAQLKLNVAALKKYWKHFSPKQQKIYYSVKANPNLHLLKVLDELVEGFDVSSAIELETLLGIGVDESRITVSGPAKTSGFLRQIAAASLQAIHLDSLDEYEELTALSKSLLSNLSLRLATEDAADQKLGFTLNEVGEIARKYRSAKFVGLHAYLGRDRFCDREFTIQVQKMINCYTENKSVFLEVTKFYFGAGLPDLTKISLENDLSLETSIKAPALHLECGRAAVATAGSYLAPVLSVKSRPGKRRLVIVDGGWQHIGTHLLSPIHGAKGAEAHVLRGGKILHGLTQAASIYGSLCLSRDVLHPNVQLHQEVRRGDVLLLYPCGAYGISASPNQFIGQNAADEFLINSNDASTLTQPKYIGATNFRPYQLSFSK